jgi:hypothetical protein
MRLQQQRADWTQCRRRAAQLASLAVAGNPEYSNLPAAGPAARNYMPSAVAVLRVKIAQAASASSTGRQAGNFRYRTYRAKHDRTTQPLSYDITITLN